VRQKVESKDRNMVLTILRTTGVVTLIAEDKEWWYYRRNPEGTSGYDPKSELYRLLF
jgi:hypothetical protein